MNLAKYIEQKLTDISDISALFKQNNNKINDTLSTINNQIQSIQLNMNKQSNLTEFNNIEQLIHNPLMDNLIKQVCKDMITQNESNTNNKLITDLINNKLLNEYIKNMIQENKNVNTESDFNKFIKMKHEIESSVSFCQEQTEKMQKLFANTVNIELFQEKIQSIENKI